MLHIAYEILILIYTNKKHCNHCIQHSNRKWLAIKCKLSLSFQTFQANPRPTWSLKQYKMVVDSYLREWRVCNSQLQIIWSKFHIFEQMIWCEINCETLPLALALQKHSLWKIAVCLPRQDQKIRRWQAMFGCWWNWCALLSRRLPWNCECLVLI